MLVKIVHEITYSYFMLPEFEGDFWEEKNIFKWKKSKNILKEQNSKHNHENLDPDSHLCIYYYPDLYTCPQK